MQALNTSRDRLRALMEKISGSSALMPGASAEELKTFVQRCEEELSVVPPSEYLELLQRCNGAYENGVFLYSTHRMPFDDCAGKTCDFVEINLCRRDLEWMSEYLVFADSDMDIYVLEIATGLFQVRDRQVFNNIYEEFFCFEDMMVYVFELMFSD